MNNTINQDSHENRAVCSRCGRNFDTALEGFVHKDNEQQMCAACYRKSFERPNIVTVIINILVIPFALLLLIGGVYGIIEGDNEAMLAGLVVGSVLIIWRIIASLRGKSKSKNWERIKVAEEVIHWQCSHCGANTCGDTCEYCDSPYEG